MNYVDLLCKIEQLRAVASRTPYIESIGRDSFDGVNIYYKPVTLNKAVIKGLHVRIGSDGFVDLRQNLSTGSVKHPHYSKPRLCSDGHHRLSEEFARGRMENLLTEGLIYFNTVNPRSTTNTTPGVFDCATCGETIMDEGWTWTRDGKMCHQSCLAVCSYCGGRFPAGEVRRRTWPLSGKRRDTCDNCIERMQQATMATCIVCKEPVYLGALRLRPSTGCPSCRKIERNMLHEICGYTVEKRGYLHE